MLFRSRQIRTHRFDWVIDLQSLMRSGAVAWLANGTFTVGLDDAREGARGFYDVNIPRRSYATHAVDWYLDVLPALNVPVHRNFIWLPERAAAAQAVRDKMAELKQDRFPQDVDYLIPYDTTRFVSASISSVVQTISEAAIIVLLVVFIFLQIGRASCRERV